MTIGGNEEERKKEVPVGGIKVEGSNVRTKRLAHDRDAWRRVH